MATEDIHKVTEDLNTRKAVPFWHYLQGNEGGLDPETLQGAGIDVIDMKYKTLKKGTKVYSLRPTKAIPEVVYSMNLETFQTVFAESLQNNENSNGGIACISVFELTSDNVVAMQIREDIAVEVCMLWTESKNKDDVSEETEAKDYRKLLQSRNPACKNLLDLCFTKYYFPKYINGVVYTRQSSTYEVFVTENVSEFINQGWVVQDVVLPKSSVCKLTADQDGYLRLRSSMKEPIHAAVDDVYAQVKKNEGFEECQKSQKVVPSYDDNFPSPEEYNDHKENDHSLDYESIDIRPLSKESGTNVTTPRPDQAPPPPPTAEPVYSTIDKSAKKPKDRKKSVDQPDTPGTPTGTKPPRPPPLDTMPNSDGESPAQSTMSHKPSRPSAPPRILRGKSQSMDAGMGSSGNVSLDGKEDSVVPPPRSSVKVKGQQKPENNTRF